MRINPTDALSLLSLLSSMFGGKRAGRKRAATELFPLIQLAMSQWENGGRDALAAAAEGDPTLASLRFTLDQIVTTARSLK